MSKSVRSPGLCRNMHTKVVERLSDHKQIATTATDIAAAKDMYISVPIAAARPLAGMVGVMIVFELFRRAAVVNTAVLAGSVVADCVPPAIVVSQGGQLLHPVIVAISVIDSLVVAAIVVAGTTVVPVDNVPIVPSPVAGIALPSPLLVKGRGMDIVLVSGLLVLDGPSL